jgi:F-type H+-transporting ATPase subunit b
MRRVLSIMQVALAALLLAGAPQAVWAAPKADAHAETTDAHGGGHGEEKAGLPQLDPTHFPGQAFWFLIAFGFTYVLMRYVALPQVEGTIATRSDKVEGDVAQAKTLNEQAKRLSAELDARMNDARSRAQDQVKEAGAAEAAKLADALASQQKSLDEKLHAAQNRLSDQKKQALTALDEEAASMVEAIVKHLTGNSPSTEQAQKAWRSVKGG